MIAIAMNFPDHGTYRRRYSVPLGALLLLSALTLSAAGQVPEQKPRPKPAGKAPLQSTNRPLVDVSRWRALLDQSKSEANSLPAGEGRSYALAELADAYWLIDHAVSEELFRSAVNAARSLEAENRDGRDAAVGFILALVARRSTTLSKSLSEELTKLNTSEAQAKAKEDSAAESAALKLLDSDPKQAAQLMKMNASAGPSMGAAWLIFQITERDPAAGEELYRAYLGRFGTGVNHGLEDLLWLAGYPFGYGEAYGGAKDVTKIVGFGGFRVKGLNSKPVLASVFLDLAFKNVYATLQQAVNAPEAQRDLLGGLALFVTGYCLPEARRYHPETLPAWYSLYQTALNETTQARRAQVAERLQNIMKARSAATGGRSPEEYVSEQPKESLERAESLPDGCERDQAYAQAALSAGYTKGFTRSLELTKKIKNDSVARGVVQYIYYDIAAKSIDAGELVEADKYTDLVAAEELRTLLHLKTARVVLGRKDMIHAARAVRRAVNSAERISDPAVRAGALLAAADISAAFDPAGAVTLLREAVKEINRLPTYKGGSPSVLRKVDFKCGDAGDSWYGSFQQVGRSSLFDILSTFSAVDVEEALSIAYGLEEPGTRIRALASIARAALTPRPDTGVKDAPQP